jgi:hypothetical protein
MGVRPEKDYNVPSLSLLVFMDLQYRSKVECNLMWECNSHVASQHLAYCSLAVHILTLPFMLLPVPSRWHVVYISPIVKALSAHLRFVIESYKFWLLSSLLILVSWWSDIALQYVLPSYETEDSLSWRSTHYYHLGSQLARPAQNQAPRTNSLTSVLPILPLIRWCILLP